MLQRTTGGLRKFMLQNMSNLTPKGPYGEACSLINIENTRNNRKRLQTYYQSELIGQCMATPHHLSDVCRGAPS